MTLTLGTVSDQYSGFPGAAHPEDWDRTFYAAGPNVHPARVGPLYVTIIVPEDDPRSATLWTDDRHPGYRGWHVPVGRWTPVPTPNSTPTPDTPTTDDYARGVADGRAALQREVDAWKEAATRRAHEYARDNGLCSEFDRCMRDIGLPDRDEFSIVKDWEVEMERTVTVTERATFTVTAEDEDAARDIAEGYDDWALDWEETNRTEDDREVVDVTEE